MSMLDRLRAKMMSHETRGRTVKNIVLSTPPALELLFELNSKAYVEKEITLNEMSEGTLFGAKVIVLDTNKEIFEVG